MAKILKADLIYESLKSDLRARLVPGLSLASVRIGKEYSSQMYFTQQEKFAAALDVKYESIILPDDVGMEKFKDTIDDLNNNPKINGIVVNKPFPGKWREEDVFSCICQSKDVEGMNPYNLGLLFMGRPRFISPTVRSILSFIKLSGADLSGKDITVVGASLLIGRPLAVILANMQATVSLAHIETYRHNRLPFYVNNADVLVSSAGKPDLIKGDWVKPGAVVIDVGIGEKEGTVCGDVEFDSASARAAFITPVPGGVGRLTTLFLFDNLAKSVCDG